ncbi:DJ-1/PfpI family protein [Lysobacter korlensis]|uniref:DJ-1/PfpI family protein n=1 Tax=Lysobacter korlensis TaxID=553636 RepID=A0ABV6RPJ0_9GAMM
MQIAVMLFDGFAALDVVGPHDALTRVPGVQVTFAAERVGPVSSDSGRLALVADAVLAEIPHPDVIVVPGGAGRRRHMSNGSLHQWLRAADATSRWTLGVGEGALLLAAAGPLHGRRAASHAGSRSLELAGHGATPVGNPFVFDGKYATAADGHAALQLGAELARRIRGPIAREH